LPNNTSSKKFAPRECAICGGEFTPKHGRHYVCGKACSDERKRRRTADTRARQNGRKPPPVKAPKLTAQKDKGDSTVDVSDIYTAPLTPLQVAAQQRDLMTRRRLIARERGESWEHVFMLLRQDDALLEGVREHQDEGAEAVAV
jgi:hypothetical protein